MINDDGETLLHAAIAYSNEVVAAELLKRGIDVNRQDLKGRTPLHFAATHNNAAIALQILKNGGDISIRDSSGNTSMWTAVFNARGNHSMVELFIQHGGKAVSALKNRHGRSPVDFAAQIGDEALTRILLED